MLLFHLYQICIFQNIIMHALKRAKGIKDDELRIEEKPMSG